MDLRVEILPAFHDNYIYFITWDAAAVVVDPGEAEPVQRALEGHSLKYKHKLKLKMILCTHHHADHIGGVEELRDATRCQICGPRDPRISPLDRIFDDGDIYDVPPLTMQVLSVPGHTSSHIAFYFPKEKWLFSGDTLFAGGCGRLFEGTPEQMWSSLSKLKALPDDAKVYCGHEYTLKNLEFAHRIDPDNLELAKRLHRMTHLRREGKPTIPSTIGEEKATNPFLRADTLSLRQSLDMEGAKDVEVFAEIRGRRDNFI